MGSCKIRRHVVGPARPDEFDAKWHLSDMAIAERKANNAKRAAMIGRAYAKRKAERAAKGAAPSYDEAQQASFAHRLADQVRSIIGLPSAAPKRYTGRGG
jgi:hypothetical protein